MECKRLNFSKKYGSGLLVSLAYSCTKIIHDTVKTIAIIMSMCGVMVLIIKIMVK